MATKIYLPSTGTPDVTPSTWLFTNQVASPQTLKGVVTKISSAFTNQLTATGTTNPYVRAATRFIIGPLAAQTISGTVRMVLGCYEGNAGANATLAMAVKIIQANGSDRATLLGETYSDNPTSPYEISVTPASSRICYDSSESEPHTLTSQSASQGDYLVIEIGYRSATSVSRNVYLRYGDNSGTDFSYANDDQNDYCPWVEFSMNISWYVAPTTVTLGVASLTAAGQTASISAPTGQGIILLDAAVITATPGALKVFRGSNCIVHNGSNISISSALSYTALTFDTEDLDTDGMFAAANPSRITIGVSGLYFITARVQFAGNANGARDLGIRLNGSVLLSSQMAAVKGVTNDWGITCTLLRKCTAGEYFEAVVRQNTGAALNVLYVAGASPYFTATKLRYLYYAQVHNSTAISVASGNWAAVTFDTEDEDVNGLFGVDTSRFTAPVGGRYLFWGSVQWAADATYFRDICFQKNGDVDLKMGQKTVPTVNLAFNQCHESIIELAAGEYVEFMRRQFTGAPIDISYVANLSPYYRVALLDLS